MRISYLLMLTLFSACSDASNQSVSPVAAQSCEINFKTSQPCVYKEISARLIMTAIEEDEMSLEAVEVINKSKKQTLNITADTSLIEGDKGYISFKDINFDAIPDLAITTSFGLANLYMDYWVFDNRKKQYVFVGNFQQFRFNEKAKTLSNTVKVSAAEYKHATYEWDDMYRLVKKK